MQIVRRTLFDSELLRVGHVVVARPSSSECGEIERQSLNILVLPLAGVFAKHDVVWPECKWMQGNSSRPTQS